ncbi:SNF2 family N-terminal domain-containing protein [Gaertneriomyces semiglobifer]|nr:SNF2 family N-terminal domain-containing protein [Gaertneriomyces semiglobifer]
MATDILDPADASEWDEASVGVWLRALKLDQYVPVFLANNIDGQILLSEDLSEEALKLDLGVKSLGHRLKILKEIRVLKDQQLAQNTATFAPLPENVVVPHVSHVEQNNHADGDIALPFDSVEATTAPATRRSPIIPLLNVPPLQTADDGLDLRAFYFVRSLSGKSDDEPTDFAFFRAGPKSRLFDLYQPIAQRLMRRLLRTNNVYDIPQHVTTDDPQGGCLLGVWRPPPLDKIPPISFGYLIKEKDGDVRFVPDDTGRCIELSELDEEQIVAGKPNISKLPVLVNGHGFAPVVVGGYSCSKSRKHEEDGEDDVLPVYGASDQEDYEPDSEWEKDVAEDERLAVERHSSRTTPDAEGSVAEPALARENGRTLEETTLPSEDDDMDDFTPNGARREIFSLMPSGRWQPQSHALKPGGSHTVTSERFLTSNQIKLIVDEEMEAMKQTWTQKHLPKAQKSAFQTWCQKKDDSLAIEAEIHDLKDRRLRKLIDEILAMRVTSARVVRAQCKSLEPTVHGVAELDWQRQLIQGPCPAEPISGTRSSPRRRNVGDSLPNVDEQWSDFLASEDEYADVRSAAESESEGSHQTIDDVDDVVIDVDGSEDSAVVDPVDTIGRRKRQIASTCIQDVSALTQAWKRARNGAYQDSETPLNEPILIDDDDDMEEDVVLASEQANATARRRLGKGQHSRVKKRKRGQISSSNSQDEFPASHKTYQPIAAIREVTSGNKGHDRVWSTKRRRPGTENYSETESSESISSDSDAVEVDEGDTICSDSDAVQADEADTICSDSDADQPDEDDNCDGRKNIKSIRPTAPTTKALQSKRAEQDMIIEERAMEQEDFSVGSERLMLINRGHGEDERPIYMPQFLSAHLKEHQVEGIRFLWKNIIMIKQDSPTAETKQHAGCVLAHAMGLGKTLQVITFVYTLLREISSGNCTIPEHLGGARVLVVAPTSVIINWEREFKFWIFEKDKPKAAERAIRQRIMRTLTIVSTTNLEIRKDQSQVWDSKGGVLIVSYHLLRSMITMERKGKSPGNGYSLSGSDTNEEYFLKHTDLLVCDEAHVLKNSASAITMLLQSFETPSRICLTGSPLQNNLKEYWCMINFAVPSYLGTLSEFRNQYENPVSNGFHSDSSPADVRLAKQRLWVLNSLIKPMVLRRDARLLKAELPPKREFVISVRLTPVQWRVYCALLSLLNSSLFGSKSIIACHTQMLLICAHAGVFVDEVEKTRVILLDKSRKALKQAVERLGNNPIDVDALPDEPMHTSWSGDVQIDRKYIDLVIGSLSTFRDLFCHFPDHLAVELSHKMMVLLEIIETVKRNGEKVLVFFRWLSSLEYVQTVLRKRGEAFHVISGDVVSADRQKQIDSFTQNDAVVFLITSQSGGTGLNLTAASRVVIFELGWNPQEAEQAIARAYRYGTNKAVFVYRLQTYGTMESVLYKQSVHKIGLAKHVVDEKHTAKNFSMKEMKAYFVAPEEQPAGLLTDEKDARLRAINDVVLNSVLDKFHESLVDVMLHEEIIGEFDQQMTEEETMAAKQALEEEMHRRQVMRTGHHAPPPMRDPNPALSSELPAATMSGTLTDTLPNTSPTPLAVSGRLWGVAGDWGAKSILEKMDGTFSTTSQAQFSAPPVSDT